MLRSKARLCVAVMLVSDGFALGRGDCQQAGDAAAADVVDSRKDHVVALDQAGLPRLSNGLTEPFTPLPVSQPKPTSATVESDRKRTTPSSGA